MVEVAPFVFVPGHTRSVGAEVGARHQQRVLHAAMGTEACETPLGGQHAATEPTGANYDPNGDWTAQDATPEGEVFAP